MSAEGLGSDTGSDPLRVARFTAAVRRKTKLPILAKMTPNITNMEIPAAAAIKAGADGISAINTIKSVTSVLESPPHPSGKPAVSGYSGRAVKPIALRFISELRAALPETPISGMGGIESWRDAAEFMAAGCANVQVTTAVMQYGYRIIDDLTAGLAAYLSRRGITCAGLVSSAGIIAASDIDRKTVVYPMFDRDVCVGCGRCALSCADGGHQAITLENGKPKLIGSNCEGCMLCSLVCPVGAVSQSKRVAKKNKQWKT
jgi:dihydropyrimidine dehydrogenase (NAD+) subunit PreA